MTPEERSNALTNEAALLLADGDPQELPIETLERAGELLEAAYKRLPGHPRSLYNVGNIRDELSLARGGCFVSKELYERSLALRVSGAALLNLGRILDIQEGRHAEAIRLYKQAAIQQQESRAAIALGPSMLMQACRTDDPDTWREGWYWMEYRKGSPENFFHPARWRGEPLKGKRLVIVDDFGLGDRVWAMRWVLRAKEEGATTILIADDTMQQLYREQPYIDEVHRANEGGGVDCDYMTKLMSMIGYMDPECRHRTAEPYIGVPITPLNNNGSRLRVGLFWEGSTRRGYPAWRNIPAADLLRVLPDGIDYVSLQKSCTVRDPGVPNVDWETIHTCDDLLATARLITSLDLVVTVGSMISMLAPALGIKTWVMNTYNSAWQFGPADHDPHWFPPRLLRQFRQAQPHSWQRVLGDVADRLDLWVQADHARGRAA